MALGWHLLLPLPLLPHHQFQQLAVLLLVQAVGLLVPGCHLLLPLLQQHLLQCQVQREQQRAVLLPLRALGLLMLGWHLLLPLPLVPHHQVWELVLHLPVLQKVQQQQCWYPPADQSHAAAAAAAAAQAGCF
jgi:hypothetical protein